MKRVLYFLSAAITIAMIVSCNKDEGTIPGGKDPEGTITINLRNSGGYGVSEHDLLSRCIIEDEQHNTCSVEFQLWLNPSNNLSPKLSDGGGSGEGRSATRKAEIVSLGSIKGLGAINTNNIPSVGWASDIASVESNGYILRFSVSWQSFIAEYYYGVYVVGPIVGTDNGIIGYTVKYCPFTPGKGWNQ